jgi:hypothetical protein
MRGAAAQHLCAAATTGLLCWTLITTRSKTGHSAQLCSCGNCLSWPLTVCCAISFFCRFLAHQTRPKCHRSFFCRRSAPVHSSTQCLQIVRYALRQQAARRIELTCKTGRMVQTRFRQRCPKVRVGFSLGGALSQLSLAGAGCFFRLWSRRQWASSCGLPLPHRSTDGHVCCFLQR